MVISGEVGSTQTILPVCRMLGFVIIKLHLYLIPVFNPFPFFFFKKKNTPKCSIIEVQLFGLSQDEVAA